MHHGRTAWVNSAIAAILGICVAGAGCNTLPCAALAAADGQATPSPQARAAAPEPAGSASPGGAVQRVGAIAGVLQPRSQVYWSIEAGEPRKTLGGPTTVGPDGTLALGPYGQFPVAGLTVEQARARIEQQLARLVRNPKVSLQVAEIATAAEWTKPAPTAQFAVRPEASATGVKSTWRPAQRQTTAPELMAVAGRDNQFATEAPRTMRPGGWQPAGQSGLRPAGDTGGPELGPPPRTVTPPPEAMMHGNVAGLPLGPEVGPPMTMPGGPPMAMHGGPVPVRQPFGRGHAPWEGRKIALPPYVIAPPDILQIDSYERIGTQAIGGPHLVRPDGTVGLGAYGSAFVAGMTIEQARVEIAKVIHARLDPSRRSLKDVLDGLNVDVLAYNSRVYYVITNRLGFGTLVQKFPITGNETVIDAISQIGGLPPEASKHCIWLARKTPGCGSKENKLPVDWCGIAQRGEMKTNYQLLPGDRLFVQAEPIQRVDFVLSKWLAPVQRLFGATLLGSQTVNSIRSGSLTGGGGVVR